MQRQKCKKVGLHFKRRALTALLFVYFPLEWAMNDEVKNTSSMMMMQRTMAKLEWDSRESHAYLLFNPIYHVIVDHQHKLCYCWTQILWNIKIPTIGIFFEKSTNMVQYYQLLWNFENVPMFLGFCSSEHIFLRVQVHRTPLKQ